MQKLRGVQQRVNEEKLAESLRRQEAETEVLELDDFHRLVTQDEARQRRERVMAAQPQDKLREVRLPAAGEGPVQPPAVQRCGWKDRHIRQKGSAQLREVANAQLSGAALQVRSKEEREARPMQIHQEADAAVQRHGEVLKYQLGKEQRDQLRADGEMERASRAMQANMLREKKARPGKMSPYSQVLAIQAKSFDSPATRDKRMMTNYIRILQSYSSDTPERLQLLSDCGEVIASLSELNRLNEELEFRRTYVLPAMQSRGVRRPDMVDSVNRLEQRIRAMEPALQRRKEEVLDRVRRQVGNWRAANPNNVVPPEIIKGYQIPEMEIVDLEEEERRMELEAKGASTYDDDGIEEI